MNNGFRDIEVRVCPDAGGYTGLPSHLADVSQFMDDSVTLDKDTEYRYYCKDGRTLNPDAEVTYTCEASARWSKNPGTDGDPPGTCSSECEEN